MKTEKSCGALVFTRVGGDERYVIIRNIGGHWGFPKGHMEPGEDERTTALREIREEVGLVPVLLEGFREEESYPLPGKSGVTKQVVYFLGEYADQDIRIQPEEIAEARLLTCEEALRVLTFRENREILKKAHGFLQK